MPEGAVMMVVGTEKWAERVVESLFVVVEEEPAACEEESGSWRVEETWEVESLGPRGRGGWAVISLLETN